MEKRTFGSKNQILADVNNFKSLSVVLSATGALTADNGKKYFPAGTPIGGADPFADEQALLKITNTAALGVETKGVLLHDVYFGTGATKGNGTLLYFGTVNEFRIPNVTVVKEAKDALNSKVYFVKRNK